jgi:hypothetical protein
LTAFITGIFRHPVTTRRGVGLRETDRKRLWVLGRPMIILAGILATLVATSGLTFGLLNGSANVRSTGVIATTNVGIYTTQTCTANLTSITWGTVYPGSNYTRTGYICNNGNLNMTLSLSTANWSPAAAGSVVRLVWNYDGRAIRPGQVLAVSWTLRIPPTISGVQDFSFDIVVSGGG